MDGAGAGGPWTVQEQGGRYTARVGRVPAQCPSTLPSTPPWVHLSCTISGTAVSMRSGSSDVRCYRALGSRSQTVLGRESWASLSLSVLFIFLRWDPAGFAPQI